MSPSARAPHTHPHHHSHHHHHASNTPIPPSPIWWSNTIFFIGFHLFALYSVVYLVPPASLPWQTWILCLFSWQAASFGITIGYHRLWSHKSFTATLPLRIVLAWMGSLGFQGSVKWWVMRHRLHHRFTDDPIHDPYSATRGLWFAHCGWIFKKPNYPRMKLIEKDDLESDPVVRFQHRHFVIIALFSGLVLPTMVAKFGWNDAWGGYVYGGLVARLLIWHTTFCINSLAHWTGLQPYTEEVTARGNYLLALLTSGEGNHNFHHLFPSDFRNGPHPQDWDPTKWIIYILHMYTPLVPTLRRTKQAEINKARAHVHQLSADRLNASVPAQSRMRPDADLPKWSRKEVEKRVREEARTLLLIEGYLVDVTEYLEEHPGGPALLSRWAIRLATPQHRTKGKKNRSPSSIDSGYESLSNPSSPTSPDFSNAEEDEPEMATLTDATRAFFGQINNHSQAAKETMRCARVGILDDTQDELQ